MFLAGSRQLLLLQEGHQGAQETFGVFDLRDVADAGQHHFPGVYDVVVEQLLAIPPEPVDLTVKHHRGRRFDEGQP